MDIKVI